MILPDRDILTATQRGKINISPALSTTTQTATVLKNLKSSSLILLGNFFDKKCTIVMDSNNLYATKSKNISIKVDERNKIMQGVRNNTDGLYNITIHKKN